MPYTKQVSYQRKKIRKQKFIMALVKEHLSSDMRAIKNIQFRTIKRILEYYSSKQNSEYILGDFGNPQIIQPKF